jgi:hypothetical protein
MKVFAAAFLLLTFAALASTGHPETIDDALKAAQARHVPVFVDVSAPWCHSCYFMQKNVMIGAEWAAITQKAITVELDGDAPGSERWLRQWKIGGYPSYIVLNENGREIGRILGDRPRAQFYAELNPILARGTTLDQLKARVSDANPASASAGEIVLKAYYEREDYIGALVWLSNLPAKVQQAIKDNPRAAARIERIELLRAATVPDAAQCQALAPVVFSGMLSCDLGTELSAYRHCIAQLSESGQKQALAPFKPKLENLQKRVLVSGKGPCSDTRGLVDMAADYYGQIGDQAAQLQVLHQGIAYSEHKLKGHYAKDRNLADNLRYYLDRAGDTAALDALFPKLIKAYPGDYVYAYRFGKSLAQRGDFSRALTYLEQSAPKAYGRNRLWVAEWRAYVLIKLNRSDEARTMASDAMKTNGPWFPEIVADLKAVLDGNTPT